MNDFDASAPLVSVIINCKDCGLFLSSCVASVVAQTYSNIEIIVFDNNSSNDIREILDIYDDQYSNINYFRSGDDLTLCQARKRALDCSSGEFFCYLDSDDYIYPNKVYDQVRFLMENTQLYVVASKAEIEIVRDDDVLTVDYWNNRIAHANIGRHDVLLYRPLFMSSMLFRSELKQILYQCPDEYNHSIDDFVISNIVCKYDEISVIDDVLFRYSIHPENLSKKQNVRSKYEAIDVYSNLNCPDLSSIYLLARKMDLLLASVREVNFRGLAFVLSDLLIYTKMHSLLLYVFRRTIVSVKFRLISFAGSSNVRR